MFYNDKKINSIADAVRQVTEAEKVQTPTGMKVYGSSYGNSQKARADQTKKDIDKIKGPKDKEMKEELKGNQDKIDANHNGKVDSQDFKILRGKKKVKEDNSFASRLINHTVFAEKVEEELNEVLSKDAAAGDWIHDFVHSDNPKFKGKSKAERKKMALGAYYAKQNEEKETHDDKGEEAEDKALIKKMVKKDALKEEELDEAHYQMDDSVITTDTLAGRSAGGKANSFKSFKLRVKPLDKEGDGESKEPGCDTPEKTPARASIHAEEVEESFEEEHGIGRDIADKKEKMDRLKTPAKPGPLHNVAKGFKAFIKGKSEPMESVEVEGEQIDEKKDLSPGQDDAPFDPPYTTGKPDNVKDKSGAVHTPMSRARDLARKSLEKVKKDISGK
jgi:hypothetical protein